MGPAVNLRGPEQFLAVYKVATRSSGLSLGASGAICSVIGMFPTFQPDTQLSILFLPLITFSARLGIRMMMVADCSGMVLRWRYLDYDYKDHFGIFKAFKGK